MLIGRRTISLKQTDKICSPQVQKAELLRTWSRKLVQGLLQSDRFYVRGEEARVPAPDQNGNDSCSVCNTEHRNNARMSFSKSMFGFWSFDFFHMKPLDIM